MYRAGDLTAMKEQFSSMVQDRYTVFLMTPIIIIIIIIILVTQVVTEAEGGPQCGSRLCEEGERLV